MRSRTRKLLLLTLLVLLLAGAATGAWLVDQMAVAYLTGQRRAPGRDWFGREVRMGGPPPGYVFLGRSRPSEQPAGFQIVEPWQKGAEAGLRAGDVVTSVDGRAYSSSFDLVGSLLVSRNGGDEIELTVERARDELRMTVTLEAFYRSPADLGLAFEDVEMESGSGLRLRGWFVPGPADGHGRAVAFVHGANSSRFQALDGLPYWHARGYSLLTMDLSGRGNSEGEYITYSINERKDIKSMVEWLRRRPDVLPRNVVVFGTSNGAASAIFAAAEIQDTPPLVLDAPYSDLWTVAGEMLGSRGYDPRLLHALRWAVQIRAGVDLTQVRPLEAVDRFRSPVLLIHGDSDTQVPPYHSEVLHQARLRAGLPSERWVIPGGEHGFDNYPPAEEFWNRIIDFCDRSIQLPSDNPPPATTLPEIAGR